MDLNKDFQLDGRSDTLGTLDSIDDSIENIISHVRKTRLFNRQAFTVLPLLLFKPVSSVTSVALFTEVVSVIELYEPRILIDRSRTQIAPDPDNNRYFIRVAYMIRDTGESGQTEFFLER